MLLFSLLAAAVAPGLALLTYFYLKDRYDYEPLHMVLRVFLMGILIVLPVMIIQRGMMLWLGDSPLLESIVISGGVEEFVKWFVIYHIIYNHTEFDEPYDGILYSVAVSLGFATVENVLYAFAGNASVSGMFLRALLPVSGHAMFAVIMGYYMGKAKFIDDTKKKRWYLSLSLILPFFWHALYDVIMNMMVNHWLVHRASDGGSVVWSNRQDYTG